VILQKRLRIFVLALDMNFFKSVFWFFVIGVVFACSPAQKQVLIPVNDFFKSQDKATYRISPDGKSISYLKLQDQKQNLFVENISTGEIVQLTKLKDKNIIFYSWVSDNELIYYKEKNGDRYQSDLFITDKTGKNQKQLSKSEKDRLRVLEDQIIAEKYLLVLSNKRDSTVSDVYRLNIRNGQMQMVALNPGNITNWMTDSQGKLRMAISSDGVNQTLLYREQELQNFKPIFTSNFKTTLFPIAFAEDKVNTIYAISDANRDKQALVELDCVTGKEKKVLFENDSLNVVDAQYSRQRGKMEYVVYETWKKQKHFLDQDAKSFHQKLDKLLPKTEYRIIDRDKSENVFVLRTFTDRNPGSFYLYIANTGKLRKLNDINSAIDEQQMSEMKPISFRSRDGLKINGYLTLPLNGNLKNLPLVVVPHNGPGLRNTWGYNAEVQFLANRGYAVLQVNYRGSTGYGKQFYSLGLKQGNQKIQDDLADGIKWLIDSKTVDQKKIAIYGTGFGGYIALNAVIKNPSLYKCAASNSGILNLFSYLNSIPPYYKSNLQMYYDIIGNPVTEVDYMSKASPLFNVDKIKTPIFIAQNIKDTRTDVSDAIRFVKELKKRDVPVSYHERDESSFSINREESRQQTYAALEQFLNTNLKVQ